MTDQDHGPASGGSGRAAVVHVVIERDRRPGAPAQAATTHEPRSIEGRVEEAVGLARAIDLEIVHAEAVSLRELKPKTLFGPGHVERLKNLFADMMITVVVVDGALTPIQQRSLEKAWNTKVIDRTGLILEIFGARARTHEGRLQVELAALSYQKSRLVRSWTHLERQRGGFGFLGGPGESQLELDRRLIGDRIARLKRELVEVKRTRGLHREARAKVPHPVVALVGYTNAGKSTLFNRLTRATVLAEDMLFATLDPTMRGLTLPSGRRVILSDTVGFISELPTQLVAAFRATLEEVLAADVVLHVRDMSHPDTAAQKADVEAVLRDLGIGEAVDRGLPEVRNKMDLLSPEAAAELDHDPALAIRISALTGAGIPALLDALDVILNSTQQLIHIDLDSSDGAAMAWLYRHGDVRERVDDEAVSHLTVGLDPANLARLERTFPALAHRPVETRRPGTLARAP